MATTCSDILGLAEKLAKGNEEVDFRSGISRSYYAAYHHVCGWESRLPSVGSSSGLAGGVHQQLINRLNNPAPECSTEQKKTSRVLSAMMTHAKTKRHTADYLLDVPVAIHEAEQSVENARVILAK